MKNLSVKFLLCVAILLLSLAACREEEGGSKGSGAPSEVGDTSELGAIVLAKVGDEEITTEELEVALSRVPERKREASRDRVLDRMIRQKVFSEEARKAGLETDPEVKKALEKMENETLARSFVKRYVDREAEPSEEELKEYYLENKDSKFVVPESLLIQHIVLKDQRETDRPEAQARLLQLRGGRITFEELANKESICDCWKKEGRHGWFYRGRMHPELEKVAFDLEIGALSDLIRTKRGWEIIKVHDKREKRLVPFEEARPKISTRLVWSRREELVNKYYKGANVNAHPNEEGVLAKIGEDAITEETLAPMLAVFTSSEERRENAKVKWINHLIEIKVFSNEARKVKLENDPEIVAELKRKTDQVLADAFHKKYIKDKLSVSDKDVEDFYRSHPEEFRTPLKIRVKSILVKTKEEAEDVLKELKEGASFAQLAVEKSLYPSASRRGGEIGWFGKGEKDPALEKVAFSLGKGEVSDVIKTEAGYEVIKLTDKKGGEVRPLDKMKQSIEMDLMRQRFEEQKQHYYQKAGVKVIGAKTPIVGH